MTVFTIAGRELRSLFLSPLAWVVGAAMTLFSALIFLSSLQVFLERQGSFGAQSSSLGATAFIGVATIGTFSFVMLFVAPIISMRAIAEERRANTLVLLLASPASLWQIVAGKFLGLFGLFFLMLTMVLSMPLALAVGTSMDWMHLSSAVVGAMLQLGVCAAIGLYFSSLTRTPTIAAVSAIVATLFLYLIDIAGQMRAEASEAARWLSLSNHGQSFAEGRVSTTDVAYYLIVMFTFLTLTVRRLDADRLPH
jgi:ABC-2 type transport system permease protein